MNNFCFHRIHIFVFELCLDHFNGVGSFNMNMFFLYPVKWTECCATDVTLEIITHTIEQIVQDKSYK